MLSRQGTCKPCREKNRVNTEAKMLPCHPVCYAPLPRPPREAECRVAPPHETLGGTHSPPTPPTASNKRKYLSTPESTPPPLRLASLRQVSGRSGARQPRDE